MPPSNTGLLGPPPTRVYPSPNWLTTSSVVSAQLAHVPNAQSQTTLRATRVGKGEEAAKNAPNIWDTQRRLRHINDGANAP